MPVCVVVVNAVIARQPNASYGSKLAAFYFCVNNVENITEIFRSESSLTLLMIYFLHPFFPGKRNKRSAYFKDTQGLLAERSMR
jgi:hypothetical protein